MPTELDEIAEQAKYYQRNIGSADYSETARRLAPDTRVGDALRAAPPTDYSEARGRLAANQPPQSATALGERLRGAPPPASIAPQLQRGAQRIEALRSYSPDMGELARRQAIPPGAPAPSPLRGFAPDMGEAQRRLGGGPATPPAAPRPMSAPANNPITNPNVARGVMSAEAEQFQNSRAQPRAAAPAVAAPAAAPPVAPPAQAAAAPAAPRPGVRAGIAGQPGAISKLMYGAGRVLASPVGKAAGAASVLANFNDYKIDDPTVDSSAAGTIGALAKGQFAQAGRSAMQGLRETAMDVGSFVADTADVLLPGQPASTAYNQMLQDQVGTRLVDNRARPGGEAVAATLPAAPQPAANTTTNANGSTFTTDPKTGTQVMTKRPDNEPTAAMGATAGAITKVKNAAAAKPRAAKAAPASRPQPAQSAAGGVDTGLVQQRIAQLLQEQNQDPGAGAETRDGVIYIKPHVAQADPQWMARYQERQAKLNALSSLLPQDGPVEILRPGGQRTVAMPELGYAEMDQGTYAVQNAANGGTGGYIQALAQGQIAGADPTTAKLDADLAVKQLDNQGNANVAGINAGSAGNVAKINAASQKTVAEINAENAKKNVVLVPGEEYMASDGLTKLRKPSRLYDYSTGQFIDMPGQGGAQLPAGLVVGAKTKQPDGTYNAGGRTVTIKGGKVVEIK